jgi:uncharacterized protein (TIGR00255 family)
MTGFGRGTASHASARATVDMRSVNHRFLDIKTRGYSTAAVDDAIARALRTAGIERGSISTNVHVVRATTGPSIDRAAAAATHAALVALARDLQLPPPDLALVLAQPGVVTGPAGAASDLDADLETIATAATSAATALVAMRATEGAALASDLAGHVAQLRETRARIHALSGQITTQVQNRVSAHVSSLLANSRIRIDYDKLANEVAFLAERADISEELVRVASHLDQTQALIAEPRLAVGRRLDFLVQEIGREVNTIGNKSASTEMSTLVVDAKATLERMREQVQNVE